MLAIVTSHPIQYQAPLWRALAAAGVKFEVWFLTPHAVQQSYDREFGQTFAWDVDLLAGYPNRFLPIAPDWKLNHFRGIKLTSSWRDEFAKHGITHLWVEGWRFFELWKAVAAAHAGGMQVWLRGENHGLAPESFLRGMFKKTVLSWLFNRVDKFLCIGIANERFYVNHGVRPEKLRRAPYCVDNAYFSTQAELLAPQRFAIRHEWGIADDAFCLLFCGKLIAKKHPLDLVAAAGKLTGTRRVHLLFAGSGELGSALQANLAESPALAWTITGFLNQSSVPRAFAAADCLVLPSDYGETWGLVVNEALASGRPAIISDRCGCADDLGRAQGPSHVFPFENTSALASCIEQVMQTTPDQDKLHRIIDAYSVHRTVETVRTLLSSTAVPV